LQTILLLFSMKVYKHIFFDLDRTLWDFDKSSLEIFSEIYNKYELKQKGISSLDLFLDKFNINNNFLWGLYKEGIIKKEILKTRRFELTLSDFGINNLLLAVKIGDDYININILKAHFFPYTIEILTYLKSKYSLHIITNGFKEVQLPKLIQCGLNKYFKNVFSSDDAGYLKPDKRIFEYALKKSKALTEESIMIGDEIDIDIKGANSVGMDQILFNPQKKIHTWKATYEINSLIEIKDIL
jgi:putative hydrolase of the HAD superfamily